MRILVFSPEPLPLPGMPVRPLGLRAWSLAFGLRSAGMADVKIACPAMGGAALPPIPGLETYGEGDEAALLERIAPEILIAVSADSLLGLPFGASTVALDVSRPEPTAEGVASLRRAIERSDFVTCATAAAVHFLEPLLIDSGFAEAVPAVIPTCVAPDQPPVASRDGAPSVLALRLDGDFADEELVAIHEVVKGKPGAKLDVISHSDGIAFDSLLTHLARADVVVSARPASLARSLHPADATMLALWAGVPVIHDQDDALGAAIDAARAGWNADEELARLLSRLLSKPDDMRRRARRASDLVRSSYTWNSAVAPLVAWIDAGPRRRVRAARVAEVESVPVARKTRLRRGEISAAESPLGRIAYAPAPPDVQKATPVGLGVTIVAMALLLPIGVMLLLLFGLAELARMLFAGRPQRGRRRR